MKQLLSIFMLAALLAVGCKKNEAIPDEQFVSGDLSIGITSKADLSNVFATFNSLDFKITTMHGFYYNANLPVDSLKPLLTFLNTKTYINTGTGWTASGYYYEPEKTIRVMCSFFNMTPSNQADLLNLVSSLNLLDRQEETKRIFIKVPIGTEKYWLAELKKYSFVKWTELNYTGQIQPH